MGGYTAHHNCKRGDCSLRADICLRSARLISLYIYCAISTNEEEINNKKEAFALIGYDGIIKKEYLYNRANNVIENKNSYDFYIQMIDNLLNSLNNQAIEISDEFLINPVDIELLTWINMLSSIQNSDYKGKIQLQTYKMIIEKLK